MLTNFRIEGIYNMMESVIWDLLGEAEKVGTVCMCSVCQRDMAAYSLNRLPSHYVSTREGESRLIESQVKQFARNIVGEAIDHVSKHPHRQQRTITEFGVNELLGYIDGKVRGK